MPNVRYLTQCDLIHRGESISQATSSFLEGMDLGSDDSISIVSDFDRLMEYLAAQKLQAGGKAGQLPIGKLQEINAFLTRPLPQGLKRPQLKSFPNVRGLFLLLRASGLLRLQDNVLLVDPDQQAIWCKLNFTEQYFSLLAAWLEQARPEILGENRSPGDAYLSALIELTTRLMQLEQQPETEVHHMLRGDAATWVAMMEMLGWLDVEYLPRDAGKPPRIKSMRWLPLGDAMSEVLYWHWLNHALLASRSARDLSDTFRPLFPALKHLLPPDPKHFQAGTYTLRVSLHPTVWRKIKISAEENLETLAEEILSAFNFDNDHLYCFEVRDRRGRQLTIDYPDIASENELAHEVQLGELPLDVGDEMTFHFDFGDDWLFAVKLEAVQTDKKPPPAPKVIARKGKAPPQYSYGDDW